MYRRRVKKPPVPVFPETLEEMGYIINERSQIIDSSGKQYTFDLKAKNRDYQEAHSRALADVTVRSAVARMEKELGLVEAKVPFEIEKDDTTTPHANILMSPDVKQCKRLLVLVPGTKETVGSWSRRILTKFSVEEGSMFYTAKRARAEGYGIVMLNPNAQYWVNDQATIHTPITRAFEIIPSLRTPEEHADYVLRHLIQSCASKEIYFIAHKYGAEILIQAIHAQFDFFRDRVAGIALVEGTYSIHCFPDLAFRSWWSKNAAGYIPSEEDEIKNKVEYRDATGCNCVVVNTKEYDYTIMEVMPDIFRFFNTRKNRDNSFNSYKDAIRPLNEDDPTTAMVAIHVDQNGEDGGSWDESTTATK
ncbi:hypothetical protein BG011_001132 [Mortierella polycephala]|uniref:Arb2 domain-containing protein n=1 Tax=Mortierella polycephala TaxID=41804 RepID=A0A9P6Q9R3_9FUNG|nr:hypothetical protein BG011_001132 [Mortierella polycephala]